MGVNKLDQFMYSDEYDVYKEGEYVIDKEAKEIYLNALKALKEMCKEMICDLEINDPNIPYQYHSILVKWRLDENGMIEPKTETLIKGLKEMDLCISELRPFVWQIGKQIYKPK